MDSIFRSLRKLISVMRQSAEEINRRNMNSEERMVFMLDGLAVHNSLSRDLNIVIFFLIFLFEHSWGLSNCRRVRVLRLFFKRAILVSLLSTITSRCSVCVQTGVGMIMLIIFAWA